MSSDSDSGSDSDDSPKNISFSFKRKKNLDASPSKSRRLQSLEMAKLEQSRQIHVTEEEEVDDTDGLDPETEYKQWRLREKGRVKRELEQLMAMEEQIQHRLDRQATTQT